MKHNPPQSTAEIRRAFLDYFADLFVSDDIGAEKPSETFFLEAMRRSNTQPSDVLFIGDSISAAGGAPPASRC